MAKKLSKESVIMAFLDASFFYSPGAASLSDIATRLGVKKASLYNHFSSREDIVHQATDFCSEYLKALSFIPQNIESVINKYSAESVFKGISTNYIKMHGQKPLFQIYTFIQAQKYFSAESANVAEQCDLRLAKQVEKVLNLLCSAQKLPQMSEQKIEIASRWFARSLRTILSRCLLKKKKIVVENPDYGEGELFDLPESNEWFKEALPLAEEFTALLDGQAFCPRL